jgi:hypothetical protein
MWLFLATVLFSAVVLTGCSTTAGVRPLGKGKVRQEATVSLSGSGPTGKYGAAVGVTDTTNLHAGLFFLPALTFPPTIEVGASQQLLAPEGARPRLMVDLTLYTGVGPFLCAVPSALVSWDYGKTHAHTVYTGLTSLVTIDEPTMFRSSHGGLGLVLGNRLGLGRHNVDLEVKWFNPREETTRSVPWRSAGRQSFINTRGTFSFVLGYGWALPFS